jgi:acyl-CoA dehydrogenase
VGRRCISFALSAKEQELQARVKDFVAEKVIPFEKDERRTRHGPTEGLRKELVGLAREAGLLSGLPEIHQALRSHVTRAVFFEAAGYSMLGPIALNIAAPDEGASGRSAARGVGRPVYRLPAPCPTAGNMHMLDLIANEAQRRQYLEPMLAGEFLCARGGPWRSHGSPRAHARSATRRKHAAPHGTRTQRHKPGSG